MKWPIVKVTAAATPEINNCLEADHSQDRPVKWASAEPTPKALTAPRMTDHHIATAPWAISQGRSGMNAPMANITNDDPAA